MIHRCDWVSPADELSVRYHDEEWGVPEHADPRLFESLSLEGAQAGLSWRTILAKRTGYRRAFAGFDPDVVARFEPERVDELVADPSIVRHRQKIGSVISNAIAVRAIQQSEGSFDAYLWAHVGGEPIVTSRKSSSEIPAATDLSAALSKNLKQRGFRFVGPTTVYAFMQAVGMVNDHTTSCFRFSQLVD